MFTVLTESAVIPENTGENKRDLVENDASSVESTEDLKRKIKELQNASIRSVGTSILISM